MQCTACQKCALLPWHAGYHFRGPVPVKSSGPGGVPFGAACAMLQTVLRPKWTDMDCGLNGFWQDLDREVLIVSKLCSCSGASPHCLPYTQS